MSLRARFLPLLGSAYNRVPINKRGRDSHRKGLSASCFWRRLPTRLRLFALRLVRRRRRVQKVLHYALKLRVFRRVYFFAFGRARIVGGLWHEAALQSAIRGIKAES